MIWFVLLGIAAIIAWYCSPTGSGGYSMAVGLELERTFNVPTQLAHHLTTVYQPVIQAARRAKLSPTMVAHDIVKGISDE